MKNLDFKSIGYNQLLEVLRNDFKDRQIGFDFTHNRVVSFITKDDSSSSIQIHCYVIGNSVGVVYVLDNMKKSHTYGEIKYPCKSYKELFDVIEKELEEFTKTDN